MRIEIIVSFILILIKLRTRITDCTMIVLINKLINYNVQELRECDFYSDNKYFVFDRNLYQSEQIKEKGTFSYIRDSTLIGYKLFVNTDYLTQVILCDLHSPLSIEDRIVYYNLFCNWMLLKCNRKLKSLNFMSCT